MRYVAAYLLANLGGNESPSAKDIKKILESVGINVDDEKLNKVVSELDGKDINEVCNNFIKLDLFNSLRGGWIFRTNSFDDFCRSIARDLRNAEQQKYHHLNQHNIIYQYLLFVCLYNAIQSIYAVLNYTKFDIS